MLQKLAIFYHILLNVLEISFFTTIKAGAGNVIKQYLQGPAAQMLASTNPCMVKYLA